ncbi:MAG: acyltransferase, partial [Acidobacteriota bacterium]|nr:acyltransferase [Acidobacteriota bacterium]
MPTATPASEAQAGRSDLKPGRLYLPQLDVMRFCAFLLVFFYHGLPSSDLNRHAGLSKTIHSFFTMVIASWDNGVALFFLLSAYLIAKLLQREKAITGTVDIKLFYIRRLLRIWPLYYLALAIGIVLSIGSAHSLFSPELRMGVSDFLGFVFFVKNWGIALHGFKWNPIYVLWTISSEEQFYLLWPLLQKTLTRPRLLLACVLAMVVVPLVAFWPGGVFIANHSTKIVFFLIYFPLGGILAETLKDTRTPRSTGWCLSRIAGGLTLWVAGSYVEFLLPGLGGPVAREILANLLQALGTVLIFLGFLESGERWAHARLTYLGKISYGLYVFHVMALQFVGFLGIHAGIYKLAGSTVGKVIGLPFALGLTVLAAYLSYNFYEKRFLVLKDRFAIVHSRA